MGARRRLRLLCVRAGLRLEDLLLTLRSHLLLLLESLLLSNARALDHGQDRSFVDDRLFSLNDLLLLILDRNLAILNRTRNNLLVIGHWTGSIDRNAGGLVVHRWHSTGCSVACTGC